MHETENDKHQRSQQASDVEGEVGNARRSFGHLFGHETDEAKRCKETCSDAPHDADKQIHSFLPGAVLYIPTCAGTLETNESKSPGSDGRTPAGNILLRKA